MKRVVQALFGSLSNPQGVAVDQSSGHPSSGDVYVADAGNHRVQQFTREGVFVLMFGEEVNQLGGLEPNVCRAGESCQAGVSGSSPEAFVTPEFVAVDNDATSASFRDVYVADTGDGFVSKWNPEGASVKSWGASGQLNGSTTNAKEFGTIAGVDVGSDGTLYVLNTGDVVFKFDPTGKFVGEVQLEAEFTAVREDGGLVVGPEGELFKDTPTGSVYEFTVAGVEIGLVNNGSFPVAVLAGSPTGDLYYATSESTVTHSAFNGAGEVVEPEGACPVTRGAGCAPTDSSPAGLVGSGVGFIASSEETVLSKAAEGKEWRFGPLVIVPDVRTEGASEVGPRNVRLNGFVNPDGVQVTKCDFEFVEAGKFDGTAADPYSEGVSVPCAESPGSGEAEVAVHADVSGLTPGVTYDFRLVAANANDENEPQLGEKGSVETSPPPSVGAESVSGMTGEAAVLNVSIDPHGVETKYHFEYDTRPYAPAEGAHGTQVPVHGDKTLPAGEEPVAVSAAISGLHPDQEYFWRVIAASESGTTTSPQHSFIYSTAGSTLPDNRAYELVTPDRKNASLIGDVSAFGGGVTDVALNGGRVIAEAIQCFAGAESCNGKQGDGIGSPYEFARTSAGWMSRSLAQPASVFSTSATWGYSALEDTVLFTAPTAPAGEPDFYVRSESGALTDIGPNTDPSEGPSAPLGGLPGGGKQAVSRGFSHIAWETNANWPGLEELAAPKKLYEYAGAGNTQPLLVGVTGGKGSRSLVSECGIELGVPSNSRRPGEMSADGRSVFFLAHECASGTGENAGVPVPADTVYARVDGEEPVVGGVRMKPATVALSQPSPSECGAGVGAAEVSCREAPPAGAGFEGTSEDGSKAFFLSTQQLTDDASEDSADGSAASNEECWGTNGGSGCNLYEYDFAAPAGHELVDVSAGDVSGAGPQVRGTMAFSPDGSRVYFVAGGVLSTAANGFGQKAVAGANNLYLYERDAAYPAGRTVFITALPKADQREWAIGPDVPANVSPDGQFLVFVSHDDLTPDDTSRSGSEQVFRYDAASGALNRVSIGQDGFNDNGNRSTTVPCNTSTEYCPEDARIALPELRSDPTLSVDGTRVFFESPVGLTRGALDDRQISVDGSGVPVYARNVYEWEQAGVGSCPVAHAEGCVYLISDGRDVSVNAGATALCAATSGNQASSVCLLASDASGDNVFIATADQLTSADTNTELDYYDARVCEPENGNPCIEPSRPPGPGCGSEEECRGLPGGVPSVPSGGSLTTSGSGNFAPVKPMVITRHQHLVKALRTCRVAHQHSRRRRVACERVAQRRWGAKKAGRSAKRAKRASDGTRRPGGAR